MPIQPSKKPNPASLAHGHYEAPPASTIAELQKHLSAYDRSPFRDLLVAFLAHFPQGVALDKLAQEDPYKWAKAVVALTPLAGFVVSKTEVQHTVRFDDMSDMELLALARAQRQALPLRVIEAEAAVVAQVVDDKDNETT